MNDGDQNRKDRAGAGGDTRTGATASGAGASATASGAGATASEAGASETGGAAPLGGKSGGALGGDRGALDKAGKWRVVKSRENGGGKGRAQASGAASGKAAGLAAPEVSAGDGAGATFAVTEPEGGAVKPAPASLHAKPPTKAQDKARLNVESAATLIDVVDTLVTAFAGKPASMLPEERAAIEPGLARMIGRLSPEVTGAVNAWADPLAVILGLSMYLVRVAAVYREGKGKERKAVKAAPAVSAAPGAPAPAAESNGPAMGDMTPPAVIVSLMGENAA